MNLLASPIAVASVSFLLAAVTTTVLVPQVRRMGLRFGWTDQPDAVSYTHLTLPTICSV